MSDANGNPLGVVLNRAKTKALKGGVAGSSAQVINVLSLMWLRTTMNYQYRRGGDLKGTLRILWNEGGVPRFYRGVVPALLQSPLSRFGDTAANEGILSLLNSYKVSENLPMGIKTSLCSAAAASFRLFLLPIDAWKTSKQVGGGAGLDTLITKVRQHGVSNLYHGGAATITATWIGHFPWFFTYNSLNARMKPWGTKYGRYARNAFIGFTASVVSDTCSNSVRVIKTIKQTNPTPLTYKQTVQEIVKEGGISGLFTRGLKTRILTNGIQGMVFSVGWRVMQDILDKDK